MALILPRDVHPMTIFGALISPCGGCNLKHLIRVMNNQDEPSLERDKTCMTEGVGLSLR
jgi:hypothetical protein